MTRLRDGVLKEKMKKFRAEKVMKIDQLETLFNCSVRTVHRRLKEWQAISSYNYNGCDYTLADVPVFDDTGLWCFNGIYFSKYGSLTETVITLIGKSEAGLSAAEIGDMLKVNPHSFIWNISQRLTVSREKVNGRFVYFSADNIIEKKQHKRRQRGKTPLGEQLPLDSVGILILVEWIKHPDITLQALSGRLQQQGVNVTVDSIRYFLGHHNILKKTSDSVQL